MSDNESLLREAFAKAGEGDPTALVDLYADDFVWAGWNFSGGQQLYSKTEFLSALGTLAEMDEASTEIVSTETVADDVVTANVRCYRRKGDHVMDTTIVMVHRFDDGRVTRGADVCPAAFETFWSDAGYAS